VPYLIDGNNFIGCVRPDELRTRGGRRKFAAQLYVFTKIKKTKVKVVFDGPPDDLLIYPGSDKAPLAVLFPSQGGNADHIIKDIIENAQEKRHFYVVSSDREIRDFARKKGARPLSCRDFQKQLESILKRHKKFLEMQKEEEDPSPLEIQKWMEIFK
jgi:predicted RNA-binding protein with PIN domain